MRLNPKMESALRAASRRGPLALTHGTGWRCDGAKPFEVWNSHTIRYLAGRGLLQILSDRRTATITAAGRGMLLHLDEVAA